MRNLLIAVIMATSFGIMGTSLTLIGASLISCKDKAEEQTVQKPSAEQPSTHNEADAENQITGRLTEIMIDEETIKIKDEYGTTHALKVNKENIPTDIKVGDEVKIILAQGKAISIEKVEDASNKS